MKGGIYKNRRRGSPYMVRFENISRRFRSLPEAEKFLTRLRYESDGGDMNRQDYRAERRLSFKRQIETYLKHKASRRSVGHIRCHLYRALKILGNRNIKTIHYADLEDLVLELQKMGFKDKTIFNIIANLKAFFHWLERREGIEPPQFPRVSFELGWRKTIDKQTQARIIAEVKRIAGPVDRKVGIAIEWLARYYSIRPIELLHIREGDFDFQLGGVNIVHNKERRPKWVPFLREDLDLVQSFPAPISPDLPFFRYRGRPYGRKRLYNWWKRACANLGVEGVDLYGGTRHSTVRALRLHHTPEEIKRGSMHSTNKAFNRYFQIENEEARAIYRDTRCETKVKTNFNAFLTPSER